MYQQELKAIKKSNRHRHIELFDESLVDLASNDYLGLSQNKELLSLAFERVKSTKYHSPRASMLVNGYHQIHKEFEEYLSDINGFEDTIVVGSGYLANIALIESLVRKGDILILDEDYHASGVMASKLVSCEVIYFSHNNPDSLKNILDEKQYNRAIVCVEGIYSMGGDILNKEIFRVCDEVDALLIIDEAHSSGVIGDSLLGVYDYFNIKIRQNHIKMATLGKAIGSYGAYIQGSSHIIDYLTNRAKPIIYSTAPSIFDIALADEGYKYIEKNKTHLRAKITQNLQIANSIFNINLKTLILKLDIGDNKKAIMLKQWAKKEGFLIGAIRPPTVKSAILRIILRTNIDSIVLKDFLTSFDDKCYHSTK